MARYRTLIVDDEALARERLKRLLKDFPEIEIIGEADSGEDALEKIRARQPDLIFLDIQMPGKNGFEVLAELERTQLPRIIFVTAYDEYALRAFEVNAVDYLLKPVKRERLKAALERLPQTLASREVEAQMNQLLTYLRQPTYLQRLTVRKGDRIIFLETADILYFKAEDKYTFAVTESQEEIVDYTLNQLEEKLDPNQFVRIHRGHIINRAHLKELRRWFGGRYVAILKDKNQTQLPVSRGYAKRILPE